MHIAADLYLRRFRLDIDDNLLARKHNTQVRVLSRTIDVLLVMITLGAALMTFPAVRQYGISLFASAGVAGIVAGLAARPVLSNLMAGVQIAMTQPIRLYDAVIVENEYGTIEEITSTYVVVKLWDLRRMVVPLTYFIEKPFQNWTREDSALIGNVMIYVDYRAPVDVIRAKVQRDREAVEHDGTARSPTLQVTDFKEGTMELRCLMSARSPGSLRSALRGARKADRFPAEANIRKRCRIRARSASAEARRRAARAAKPARHRPLVALATRVTDLSIRIIALPCIRQAELE